MKKGDIVICIDDSFVSELTKNEEYVIELIHGEMVYLVGVPSGQYLKTRFKVVQ